MMKIHGEWISVATFVDRHPGGRDLLHFYLGQDASEAFDAFHVGEKAGKVLKSLPRIKVHQDAGAKDDDPPPVLRHFRALREKWTKLGYFEPRPMVECAWSALAILGVICTCLAFRPYRTAVQGVFFSLEHMAEDALTGSTLAYPFVFACISLPVHLAHTVCALLPAAFAPSSCISADAPASSFIMLVTLSSACSTGCRAVKDSGLSVV